MAVTLGKSRTEQRPKSGSRDGVAEFVRIPLHLLIPKPDVPVPFSEEPEATGTPPLGSVTGFVYPAVPPSQPVAGKVVSFHFSV